MHRGRARGRFQISEFGLNTRQHGIDNLPHVRNAKREINHYSGVLERFFVCANRYDSVIGLYLKTLGPKLRLVRDLRLYRRCDYGIGRKSGGLQRGWQVGRLDDYQFRLKLKQYSSLESPREIGLSRFRNAGRFFSASLRRHKLMSRGLRHAFAGVGLLYRCLGHRVSCAGPVKCTAVETNESCCKENDNENI